ncbi:STAS domain-containing protein [Pseudonocardia sp. CA-107938]|uniref:STAS domain-containing protein n=1 Tax=Pseudonocardia sp. CA-107938 TaxID=3240021 RepID=UPI003D8E4FE6
MSTRRRGEAVLRAEREAVDGVALVLRVVGAVDLDTRAQFEELLQAGLRECSAHEDRLVIDLSGLSWCDAGGLRCLRATEQDALARRVWLVLVAPAEHVINRTAPLVGGLSSLTEIGVKQVVARMARRPASLR